MVITGLTRNQLAGQPARGFESRRLRLKSADFNIMIFDSMIIFHLQLSNLVLE